MLIAFLGDTSVIGMFRETNLFVEGKQYGDDLQ
jgi:hypothetical protein